MLNTFDILREGGDERRWDELEDFVRQKDFASAGGRDVHPAPGGNGEEGGRATLPKVQGVELSSLPKVEKVGPTCPKWRWRSEIARVQITGSVSSGSGGASQQPSLTPQPDDIVLFF